MRTSLGGFLVVLGWLAFTRAVQNVTVDHSETSQLTYFPASKWAEVEFGAEVCTTRSLCLRLVEQDSTVDQYNRTAAMASTVGAQVSFTFNG